LNTLDVAIDTIIAAQRKSGKPLAVILAGHNGSGKSTMWYGRLADTLKIPLVNADRMMISILPERMPHWARQLRDTDTSWMQVAQKGVEAFVALAAQASVPFAMETVFSHWRKKSDGTFESKIDKLLELQAAGYFVLLLFVGLANASLSIGRDLRRIV
jgi:predicted ABC-type ATPase